MTSIAPDELLTEVRVPAPGARSGGDYLKLERKVGDCATVAVAVRLTLSNGIDRPGRHRPHGRRAHQHPRDRGRGALAGARRGRTPSPRRTARAAAGADPWPTCGGSEEYKRHMVDVYCGAGSARALEPASADTEGGRRCRSRSTESTAAARRPTSRRGCSSSTSSARCSSSRARTSGATRRTAARAPCSWMGAGEVVHDVRRAGGRAVDNHGRGARGRRRAGPDAEALPGGARPPVRVLHARDDARAQSAHRTRTRAHATRTSAGRISGNICRCTGYMNIVKAIQAAARRDAGLRGAANA